MNCPELKKKKLEFDIAMKLMACKNIFDFRNENRGHFLVQP